MWNLRASSEEIKTKKGEWWEEEKDKVVLGEMILCMLRRASLDLDVNRINMAGMTALHQVEKFSSDNEKYWQVKADKHRVATHHKV